MKGLRFWGMRGNCERFDGGGYMCVCVSVRNVVVGEFVLILDCLLRMELFSLNVWEGLKERFRSGVARCMVLLYCCEEHET